MKNQFWLFAGESGYAYKKAYPATEASQVWEDGCDT